MLPRLSTHLPFQQPGCLLLGKILSMLAVFSQAHPCNWQIWPREKASIDRVITEQKMLTSMQISVHGII